MDHLICRQIASLRNYTISHLNRTMIDDIVIALVLYNLSACSDYSICYSARMLESSICSIDYCTDMLFANVTLNYIQLKLLTWFNICQLNLMLAYGIKLDIILVKHVMFRFILVKPSFIHLIHGVIFEWLLIVWVSIGHLHLVRFCLRRLCMTLIILKQLSRVSFLLWRTLIQVVLDLHLLLCMILIALSQMSRVSSLWWRTLIRVVLDLHLLLCVILIALR